MSEERGRLIRKVLVLSWGRDGGEKACSVSGATDRDGVLLDRMEKERPVSVLW